MHIFFATHATRGTTEKAIEWLQSQKYGKHKDYQPWIRELRFWDAAMYEPMTKEFLEDLYRLSTVGENRFSLRKIFRFLKWILPIKEVDQHEYNVKASKKPKVHFGAHHIYVIGKMEDPKNRFNQEEI